MKRGFDSEPTCSKKYLKLKQKLNKGKSPPIFRMREYQENVLVTFVFQ